MKYYCFTKLGVKIDALNWFCYYLQLAIDILYVELIQADLSRAILLPFLGATGFFNK